MTALNLIKNNLFILVEPAGCGSGRSWSEIQRAGAGLRKQSHAGLCPVSVLPCLFWLHVCFHVSYYLLSLGRMLDSTEI